MYVCTNVWTEVETVHCREKPEVSNSFQRTKVCAQLQVLAAGDTVLAFCASEMSSLGADAAHK